MGQSTINPFLGYLKQEQMKTIYFIVSSILIMLSSCYRSTKINLFNDSKEVVKVSIISDEFIFHQDTIWHPQKGFFFEKGFVGIPYGFSAESCGQDSINYNGDKNIIPFGNSDICYDSYEILGQRKKLTFSLKPKQRVKIFYNKTTLKTSNISSIDTIQFQFLNGEEIQLNGPNEIKHNIRNKKWCRLCEIRIKDLTH